MGKRRWFRKSADERDPEARVDHVLESYQSEIADRLEEGLREIQDRTVALIRDIASEVDRLQSVSSVSEELRTLMDKGADPPATGGTELDAEGAELLKERMGGLQRYLASVLQYEHERDEAIGEWLQKLFVHGQGVLRDEAERMVGELGTDIEAGSEETARVVLDRLDEQTRSISFGLSVQEARIRLAMSEGQEGQADLLRDQLKVLDTIEEDLTTSLDARLAELADTISGRTSMAIDQVADRVGRQSTEAVTLGVKDLLAVIDRRFAWLEETIQDRMMRLERALGVEPTMVLPDSEVISLGHELEPARREK